MLTYRMIRFLFAAALASETAVGQTIEFDAESPMLRFAIPMLQEAASELLAQGVSISVISAEGFTAETYGGCREIGPEGFCIFVDSNHPPYHIYVGASEEIDAMYGVLDVAEQIRMGVSPQSIDGRTVDPELPFRAIKFNLPWSPYREGEAMQIHTEVLIIRKRHTCFSAPTTRIPIVHGTRVTPSPSRGKSLPLRQVSTLRSRKRSVRMLTTGDSSYRNAKP